MQFLLLYMCGVCTDMPLLLNRMASSRRLGWLLILFMLPLIK